MRSENRLKFFLNKGFWLQSLYWKDLKHFPFFFRWWTIRYNSLVIQCPHKYGMLIFLNPESMLIQHKCYSWMLPFPSNPTSTDHGIFCQVHRSNNYHGYNFLKTTLFLDIDKDMAVVLFQHPHPPNILTIQKQRNRPTQWLASIPFQRIWLPVTQIISEQLAIIDFPHVRLFDRNFVSCNAYIQDIILSTMSLPRVKYTPYFITFTPLTWIRWGHFNCIY